MTDEELAAIKARLSAALPGPWTGMTIRRSLDGDCLAIVRQQENGGATIAATVIPAYSDRDTVPLFLHARADMDALVAEVERLRDEKQRFREEYAALLQTSADLCVVCGWRFVVPDTGCQGCEAEQLRAENRKLRDVLAWTEAQCPGKCAGVCGDALTYAAKGDK